MSEQMNSFMHKLCALSLYSCNNHGTIDVYNCAYSAHTMKFIVIDSNYGFGMTAMHRIVTTNE